MGDKADMEGQFGKPEFFNRNGVSARMDTKFPHHPIMHSEANYKKNVLDAEMAMLRMSMERKAVSRSGHLPCLSVSSNASLEALTGEDTMIGFDSMFGKTEDWEGMPALPFNSIQKALDGLDKF